MLRDSICAAVFGAVMMDYFYIPFLIPNLARRIFGEGALTAALIPVYTEELQKDSQRAKLLGRCVISLLVIILSCATLIGLGIIWLYSFICQPDDMTMFMLILAAIMLPYVILICSVAAIGGLLNVHNHFASPAAAPVILNICIISGALLFKNLTGVAIAVLIAGFLQLMIQIPAMNRAGISIKPYFNFDHAPLRKVFKLMAPMVIGLAAIQINTLLDSLIAYYLRATEANGGTFELFDRVIDYPVQAGAVSHLYYAQRCYQFPLGVFGIAIATAIFPLLSKYAVMKNYKSFSETLSQGLRMVIFIALPSTVGMILVREHMVRVIFEHGEFLANDTEITSRTLLFYSLGIGMYCMQQLIVRAYYSFHDSATPVWIAIRMLLLNIILNLTLIWPLGTGGLALSTAICAALQVTVLTIMLLRKYKLSIADGVIVSILKSITATAIMSIVCIFVINYLSRHTQSSFVILLSAVLVCVIVYAMVAKILKSQELGMLIGR